MRQRFQHTSQSTDLRKATLSSNITCAIQSRLQQGYSRHGVDATQLQIQRTPSCRLWKCPPRCFPSLYGHWAWSRYNICGSKSTAHENREKCTGLHPFRSSPLNMSLSLAVFENSLLNSHFFCCIKRSYSLAFIFCPSFLV